MVVRTDKPALFVKLGLKTEELDGRFSENYFHLLPGEPIEAEFVPSNEERNGNLRKSDIELKHLRSTY